MAEICGIYYVVDLGQYQRKRHYLAQAKLSSHTHISRLFYTTKLQQVYSNPSKDTIKELRYTFPLYDGVSVGAYTIKYGETTLTGKVKQKEEAKQTYDAAIARGETASLLDYLPAGVFAVTIGNLPPKTDVHVEITYSGELKHDAGIDGLRYMLPTSIAPRYGTYPGEVLKENVTSSSISITVDVDMAKSAIRKIQSPSHPIAVSMGNISTSSDSSTFQPSQGSATLTQGSTELAKDFVLQLVIDDIDTPQAVLEQHPSLDSRAIMASLVPRFTLPPASPEIVFIADQSGSMGGSKNTELVAAMEVFLKSLPFGVRFNICAFGSSYKYLWPKSKSYNEAHLKKASKWVKTFNASYGGTEMFEPVKQAFLRKHADLPLEIVLLTDGEIWEETQLFDLINTKIRDEKVDARIFALGIGSDVSHTLVEGVARAGNGFAQFITDNEQIDQKIVRSLKACLYPHLKNYTIEVNFDDKAGEKDQTDDDDFELVEKVGNQLRIDSPPAYEDTAKKDNDTTASTSFFDKSVDKDALSKKPKADTGRYAHLPTIQLPKILQIPTSIPPLFPFNRSTVYFLLGPDAPKKNVASITLRAEGPAGPLSLKVPVYTDPAAASTLHQLAARKAVQDLEEGRGWLHEAVTQSGSPVKKEHSSRFDELVEREAVRLGETFSIAGKWTSFVAVKDGVAEDADKQQADGADEYDPTIEDSSPRFLLAKPGAPSYRMAAPMAMLGGGGFIQADACMSAPAPTTRHRSMKRKSAGGMGNIISSAKGFFGSASPKPAAAESSLFGAPASASASSPPPPPAARASMFRSISRSSASVPSPATKQMAQSQEAPVYEDDDEDELSAEMSAGFEDGHSSLEQKKAVQPSTTLRTIISCQSFNGSWQWTSTLSSLIAVSGLDSKKVNDQLATLIVLAFLEKALAAQKDVWEMVADKARAWLATDSSLDVDKAIADAKDKYVQ